MTQDELIKLIPVNRTGKYMGEPMNRALKHIWIKLTFYKYSPSELDVIYEEIKASISERKKNKLQQEAEKLQG